MKKILISLGIVMAVILGCFVIWKSFSNHTEQVTFLFAVDKGKKMNYYIMLTANKNSPAGHASLIIEKVGVEAPVSFGRRPVEGDLKALTSYFNPIPGLIANDSYSKPDPTYSPTIAWYLSDEQADRLLKKYSKDNNIESITYQLGLDDCVSFSKSIAQELGLDTPKSLTSHIPRDYIIEMIRLNLDKLNLVDTADARKYFPSSFSDNATHTVETR